MTLTVIILTYNEALHLARAIDSVASVADHVFVVDSGSTDHTVSIAKEKGAQVLVHPFENQAKQFNWALDQLDHETEWIFRLDADEIISPELSASIRQVIPTLPDTVAGASVSRRMTFLRRPICWGGVFPLRVTRLLRYGRGRSEERWMDEHILLDGIEVHLEGELLDDSLQPLGWWIDKHNRYASREAVEILNMEYNLLTNNSVSDLNIQNEAKFRRWLKFNIYYSFPSGLRAFIYFLYRYILRLGFLDGSQGATFHILQGFWYRYLVDAKVSEVKKYMSQEGIALKEAMRKVLDIDLEE